MSSSRLTGAIDAAFRCLLLLGALTGFVAASAWSAPLPEVLIEATERDAQRLTRSRKPPGVAVAVVVDGEIVWTRAWGSADLGIRRSLSTATPFPLGDVSKLYTAALALKLEAGGVVDFEARLDAALPDVEIASRFEHADPCAITLRQLLSEHAGLPAERWRGTFMESPLSVPGPLPPNDELYLLRPPGELHGYSNVGFVLAGEWLSRAAGESFERAMTTHVLAPLKLEASGYDRRAGLVVGHDKRKPVSPVFARDPAPSGMIASIDDLARFLAALMPVGSGGRSALLPAAQTRALFSPHNDGVTLDAGHGVGLGYSVHISAWRGVGHVLAANSRYPHTFGEVVVFAEHGLAVAVLGNASGDRASARFVRRLVDRLLEWRADIPPRPEAGLEPPARIVLPDGMRADEPAARYNTLAGLVPIRRENAGFVADVLGWRLHARPRPDGWYRLSWHVLGIIPVEPDMLERMLVRPVQANGRRLLLIWAGGRILVIGSAFKAETLELPWRALAGRYRLRNGDVLTEQMEIETIELDVEDDLLIVRYTLPLPFPIRFRTRIPAVPLGADRLRVPGFGGSLGEQARVHFGTSPRIEFAGYILERVP